MLKSPNNILATILILSSSLSIVGQTFVEVSNSVNINATAGHSSLGNGISFVDFDGDGYDDLTFGTSLGNPLLFFKNDGGNGFNQIYPNIYDASNTMQVLWADIDNDGDLDFFMSSMNGQSRIFENDGSFNFTDITISAGFYIISDPNTSASFCDIDNDGFLDLFISNYCYDNCFNYLYKNNGDNTFTDITITSGVEGNFGPGLASGFLDIDKDLDPDLYLAYDKVWENMMFENDGNGNFTDISVDSDTDIQIDAMNVGIGDFNNDGFLDIYVTDGNAPNVLFKNNGDGTFTDVSATAGTEFNGICWGGSFADFDNDGFEDLYVCTNHNVVDNPNKLYMNNGDETFTPISFPEDTTRSNCNTFGDFNNDGKQEIVVSAKFNDPILFFENQSDSDYSFFKVKLEGTTSNRDGIGTWIELYTESEVQYRYKTCGQAYLAQESSNVHFGISSHDFIDSLIIKWPSGIVDTYYELSSNVTIEAVEDCKDCSICHFHDDSTYDFLNIPSGHYYQDTISSHGTIGIDQNVNFRGVQSVELGNKFETNLSCAFTAEIKTCFN